MIGRTEELAWLRQQRDAAWEGRGRVVMIRGEAGIGKSRMAAEIMAESATTGSRVLLGRAHATQQPLPFGPWVDAVRSGGALAGLAADLAPLWRNELARLFPELGGPAAPARPAADDSIRLFEAFAQLLATHGHSPLVVVLEDLHWADEMSLRLLSFIGRRAIGWRTLVVVTAREEELADAPVLRRVEEELEHERVLATLTLPALSRSDTLALATALGAAGIGAPALARLGDQLWAATGGNPFVVVETMRALHERGVPTPQAGLPIPRRVRDLVAGRLDRLSDLGRRLTAVAAAIGREFDFALVQRAAGLTPADAAEAVEELARRRLLHVVGEHLDFTHDRIREVAYEQLLSPRRQILHAAIAEALEALHAANLEEVYGRIAFHYAQTDRDDMAVRYLTLFAEKAILTYAFEEASQALLDVVGRLERRPGEADGRRIVDAVSRHAYCLRCLGRFSDSADVLRSQEQRVEQLGNGALAGSFFYQLGLNYGRLGHHALAIGFTERARVEAIRCQDRLTEGLAYYGLAFTAYYAGRPREGVEHARRAAATIEGLPDLDLTGVASLTPGLNPSPFAASSARHTEKESTEITQLPRPLRGAPGVYLLGIAHLTLGLNQSLLGEF
ncbi:MAG: ATP-binding protein, partial [Candidatus Rokuibacteriota bacterium]